MRDLKFDLNDLEVIVVILHLLVVELNPFLVAFIAVARCQDIKKAFSTRTLTQSDFFNDPFFQN
jgi:hypothetical protein